MNKKSLTLRRQTVRPLSSTLLGRPRGGAPNYSKTQEDTMSRANCGGGESDNCEEGDTIRSVLICHPSAVMWCTIPGPTAGC